MIIHFWDCQEFRVQDAEKVHWVRFHIVRNGGHSVHSDQGVVLKIPLISLEANN